MAQISQNIHYEIRAVELGAQLFHVSCRMGAPDAAGQRFSLPSWIPGSYLVRDFAGKIVRVEADCDGQSVAVEKISKCEWQCAPCEGVLTLHYEVYANDLNVRGAHIDFTHAYFNGPLVFLRPEVDDTACTVAILAPRDESAAAWRVATSMSASDADSRGFGLYWAPDYDELIDHPVEMGNYDAQYFEAQGIPHQFAVTGRHSGDLERLGRDAKAICETHIAFFGEPVPIDRYVFLLTVMGQGYGGLEHRWSSSLIASRNELPRFDEQKPGENYRRLLGLVSHEYFHLWNVKRIRPAAVANSDLHREAYTRDLWIFEGITSYYDDMALLRSGVIDLQSYFELLGMTATIVWLGRGRFLQTLAESSFDAWVKLYKRDENFPNTQVNYYTKGALVALGLDLLIRQRSEDQRSLDDVMRVVWQRHGATDTPLEEGQFEAIATEVSGVPLADYFDTVVRGVQDPQLTELLSQVGVRLETAPVADGDRKPIKRQPGTPVPAALQVNTRNDDGRLVLTTVYADGPAQRAGLCSGDELVAVDGFRVTGSNYKEVISGLGTGREVGIDYFRRDELHHAKAQLEPAPDAAITIGIDKEADKQRAQRRKLWLAGKTRA